jgi:hypothetical protein
MIRELQKKYDVYTDCQTYQDLGVCNVKTDFYPSVVYEIFGHSLSKHFENRLNHPISRFYGFCGYINFPSPKRITWGFTRYVDPGFKASTIGTRHELSLNRELVPTEEPFHLDGWEPELATIAILTSLKSGKSYAYWNDLVAILKAKYYSVKVLGDCYWVDGWVNTPTLLDFFNELRKCGYYYSTDNGGMHLADILGISGTVLFGATSVRKNRPVNPFSKVISSETLPARFVYDAKNE